MIKSSNHYKILFVCLGNICRSPAAQAIMQSIIDRNGQQHLFDLDSAGLYGGHAGELPDPRMRKHAAERGYHLTHRSRKVTTGDFDRFDMIVAMDDSNFRNLKSMAPTVDDENKIVKMIDFCSSADNYDHIPDPYYEGAEGFRIVIRLLEDACNGLFNKISSQK